MVDLGLSVLRKGISGYKWFDIEVEHAIPHSTGATVDTELVTRSLTWRWDCRKQDGDATELLTRSIVFHSELKMDVKYTVMSDPVSANVKVKLQRQGDTYCIQPAGLQYTAYGEIAARIDGYDDEIVLFRKSEFETVTFEENLTLKLERSDIWVPRGRGLNIERRLHISMRDMYDDTQKLYEASDSLRFNFGDLSPFLPSGAKNGNEVAPKKEKKNDSEVALKKEKKNDSEVNVSMSWYPPQKKITLNPDDKVQWTIGDDAEALTERVMELRKMVAKGNPRQEHVKDPEDDDINKCPILAKPSYIEAKRCVRIQLQAEIDKEHWSITLAVKDDDCSGVGFMNQSDVWYDLGYKRGWRGEILPAEYNSVLLGWGIRYEQILNPSYWEELKNAGLGKQKFVLKAVRTLSRYPDVQDDDMNPRLAVVGLTIVFCESAKLEFFCNYFKTGWGNDDGVEMVITNDMMNNYVLAWEEISRTLLHWKCHFYRTWPNNSVVEKIGITSQKEALKAVHLVLNRNALPDQIDLSYTIKDGEGYTEEFIHKLRGLVSSPHKSEGVSAPAAGVLPARGDGPMWWNIQLKVDEETWTTIALRGDDLRICGFREQKSKRWYEIEPNTMLEYPTSRSLWMGSVANMVSKSLSYYGHGLLTEAVRELSQLHDERMEQIWWSTGDVSWPRVMTLQLMISYSASIKDVHDAVRQGWELNKESIITDNLLGLISRWEDTSIGALPEGAVDDFAFALIKMTGPEAQGGEEE